MNADDFVGGHSILALERFMDETRHMIIGAVFAARSMELWLLEDMGFAVVAKFSVNAGEGEYVTEYRVYKGSDWADSEISLDLEDLVSELAALCDPYYEHEQPIYEL